MAPALVLGLGLAVLVAACGGGKGPGGAGRGPGKSSGALAQAVAYAHCMRGHGIRDFPDPVTSPGGGIAFQWNSGPGSDLNASDPIFKAAEQACRSLMPGGGQPRPASEVSAQRLAAEVKWARCIRSHGVPGFPDPNAQGVFDSSRFDPSSPAFQTANEACKSLQPTGPVRVMPGHGSP